MKTNKETKKKVVIITGASSGIGLATAKRFLQEGYTVYGVALNEYKGEFPCYACNVNDAEGMEKIINEVKAKEGQIDVFVNNAGFGLSGELVDTKPTDIQNLFSTNLTSVAVNTALVGKIMKEQRFGKIINTSSLSAVFPLPYQSCYSSTKAGIEVLSRTVRGELKQYNVYVSAIMPGDVKTGFTDARVKSKSSDDKVEKTVSKFEKYERNGMTPDKVAKKIVKLAKSRKPKPRVSVGSLKLLIFLQKLLPIRALDWLIKIIYC